MWNRYLIICQSNICLNYYFCREAHNRCTAGVPLQQNKNECLTEYCIAFGCQWKMPTNSHVFPYLLRQNNKNMHLYILGWCFQLQQRNYSEKHFQFMHTVWNENPCISISLSKRVLDSFPQIISFSLFPKMFHNK